MTLVAANIALPGARRRDGRARRDRRSSCRRRSRRPRDDADVVVMAAAVADFRPARLRATPRSRSPTTRGPRRRPDDRARAQPRHPRRLVAARGEDAVAGHRRASPPRPATPRAASSTTAAPSSPARAATCWSSTRSAPTRPSARTTTPSTSCARAPATWSTPARPPRTTSPPRCGTPSRRSSDRALDSPEPVRAVAPAAARQSAAAAPKEIRVSARLFTSESVTEGHPDKICDQISRLDPRRHARRRTPAAGSPSRRWSRPGSCTSPAR